MAALPLPLKKFDTDLMDLLLKGKSFKTIEKPSQKIIMLSENQIIEYEDKILPEGAFLCGMVAKNINKLQDLKPIEIVVKPQQKESHFYNYYLSRFIKKVDNNVLSTTMLDINHCYWRTAYNLKYISEKTYQTGLDENRYIKKYIKIFLEKIKQDVKEKIIISELRTKTKDLFEYAEKYNIDDYKGFLLEHDTNNIEVQKILSKAKVTAKQARLTGIGWLKNNKIENTYYKGKLIRSLDIGNENYRIVRDNIINHVSNLYTNFIYNTGQKDNQHLFKVDAFFCDSKKSDFVEQYLSDNDYTCKIEHGFTYGKSGLINIVTTNKKYENQRPVNLLA